MAERRKLEEEMEAVREQKAVAVSKEEFQEARDQSPQSLARNISQQVTVQACPAFHEFS